MKRIAILGILLAAGCGSQPEAFEPAERATATTPDGYTAAEYDIDTDEGSLGDVKVFSTGARQRSVDGERRAVLHVGFVVENNSERVLELSRIRLDSNVTQERQSLMPSRIEGPTVVEPEQQARVDAYFVMPPGVSPQDVDAFRVRWRLVGDGATFSQLTPFMEREEYYYYSPFYDPFYHPYYTPGIGYGPMIVHDYPYRHYSVL